MVDGVRRQNKATRQQLERELQGKTELEYFLKKAVDKVLKEKQRMASREQKKRKQSAKFYLTALDVIDHLLQQDRGPVIIERLGISFTKAVS